MPVDMPIPNDQGDLADEARAGDDQHRVLRALSDVNDSIRGLRGAQPGSKLSKFSGVPGRDGDSNLEEWILEYETYIEINAGYHLRPAATLLDQLIGPARDEALCATRRSDKDALLV